MKFGNILNSYIKENNLKISLIQEKTYTQEQLLIEKFLIEAKKAKSDLFKDLKISGTENTVTAEDVGPVKFYIKGKSAKEGKSPEELKKINTKQAELFNKVFQKIREDSVGGNTTLIALTAAALKVFAEDGQNKPTQGYNLRGVLTVFITNKKCLVPPDGASVNAGSVVVDPGDGTMDSSEEDAGTNNTSDSETAEVSKFDSAVQENEPENTATSSEKSYFKVDRNARVEKTDNPDREFRIAGNYLLDTIREELPGFFNKESIVSRAKEEDAGMSDEEISNVIDKLVKLNKISLVPKGTSDDAVPDAEDTEDVPSGVKKEVEDPRDIVDRELSGSTRKGFGGASDDYSFDF